MQMKRRLEYLRRDDIIGHIPKPGVRVRRVGEGEAFDLGGDAADDRVRLLVGLLHHAHVPATWSNTQLLVNNSISPLHRLLVNIPSTRPPSYRVLLTPQRTGLSEAGKT